MIFFPGDVYNNNWLSKIKKAILWGEDFFTAFSSHLPRDLRGMTQLAAFLRPVSPPALDRRGGNVVILRTEEGHRPHLRVAWGLPVAGTLPSASAPPPGLEPLPHSQFLSDSIRPTIQQTCRRLSPKPLFPFF